LCPVAEPGTLRLGSPGEGMERRLSRREVLRVVGLGAAAAAAGACTSRAHKLTGSSANDKARRGSSTLLAADVHRTAQVHQAAFEQHVGSTFAVLTGTGKTVDLRLDAVRPLTVPAKSRAPVRGGEGFALAFSGAPAAFSQDTYAVQHADMGRFDLFLAPVGMGGGNYEAVFNRLWR